jgi:hypothetical protein
MLLGIEGYVCHSFVCGTVTVVLRICSDFQIKSLVSLRADIHTVE